jgi:hypothetical protein
MSLSSQQAHGVRVVVTAHGLGIVVAIAQHAPDVSSGNPTAAALAHALDSVWCQMIRQAADPNARFALQMSVVQGDGDSLVTLWFATGMPAEQLLHTISRKFVKAAKAAEAPAVEMPAITEVPQTSRFAGGLLDHMHALVQRGARAVRGLGVPA